MSLGLGLRMGLGAKRGGGGLSGAALTISEINALIATAGGGDFFLAAPAAGNFQDSAGTTTPAVAANDPIGYLKNLAASARHMTQGTSGAKPLLKQDGSSFWYAEFDGADDVLSNASPWMYAAGACTIIMVANVSSALTDRRLLSEGNTGSASPIYAPIQTHATTATSSAGFIRNSANGLLMNNTSVIRASSFGSKSLIIVKDNGSNVYHAVNNLTFSSLAYTRSGVMTTNIYGIGALIRNSIGPYTAMSLYGLVIVTGALADADIQAIANKLVTITGGTTI